MGYFLGARAPRRREELAPVITPREYAASLSAAIRAVLQPATHRGGLYPHAVRALAEGRPGAAVRALSQLLSGSPADAVAQRTLALAQLRAGNLGGAVRRLELCLGLARSKALGAPSLEQALRAHLDGALARLLLLPIYIWLKQREAAQALATDGLIL